jgi:diadenosine tetraphosphate (Ap4A) HIT family hydrolase
MGLVGSIALARRDPTSPAKAAGRIWCSGWTESGGEHADCPFCAGQLDKSTAMHDEVLFRDALLSVVPDRGALCPGHLLAASRLHVLSMAELGSSALERIGATLTRLCAALTPEFGDYFVFEHGTPPDAGTRGACIDHAHVHLLPLEARMHDQMVSALNWKPITGYEQLARFRQTGYAYLGIKGSHFVYPDPDIGSQWIRRQVGAALNRDDWDWALSHSHHDLQKTLESGRRALRRSRRRPIRRLSGLPHA